MMNKNNFKWIIYGVIYGTVLGALSACHLKKQNTPNPADILAGKLGGNQSNQSNQNINMGNIVFPNEQLTASIGYRYQPAGSLASYTVVAHQQLPNWQDSNQIFTKSLQAFQQSCLKLGQQQGWQRACAQAQNLPVENNPNNNYLAKTFFEKYFTAWQVSENGNPTGTFTGYYEPVLYGNSVQTQQARFPIYGIPKDFISVSLPESLRGSKNTVRIAQTGENTGIITANGAYSANLALFPNSATGKNLKGRIVGNQFVPYYTRKEINGGALNGIAPILGYANDPVELFFMHVQGSGRLQLPNGQSIRLGFADKNEYPYVSIGKYMANQGYLPLAQTSMQGIKAWIAQNPHKLAEIMGQNPSYIFFRQLNSNNNQIDGPIGALGVPLSHEYSGAVDRRYITLGAPLFVATTHPDTQQPLTRLIMAQDTGSAIKGAVRVDYFWGFGDNAGKTAGKMKNAGQVWQLLPNGIMPNAQ